MIILYQHDIPKRGLPMQLATAPTPHPRSPAQIQASRANGARSRGPVTGAGRARSSRNAFRHGLCSPAILAPGEDPAEFAALRAALEAEHAPRTPSEALLVERLSIAFWKLARADRLEATLATIEPHCPTGRLFPAPGLPRLLSRVPELNAILRYQAQLQRELHRILATLARRPAPDAPGPHEAIPRNEPEPHDPIPRHEPPQEPSHADLRNEPEPAPEGAAPEPQQTPPHEAPNLLEQARTDPALARAIHDQLLANGDLASYARVKRMLGAGNGGPGAGGPASC